MTVDWEALFVRAASHAIEAGEDVDAIQVIVRSGLDYDNAVALHAWIHKTSHDIQTAMAHALLEGIGPGALCGAVCTAIQTGIDMGAQMVREGVLS